MNWIVDHLWLLVAVTLVFAFFLSRRNASYRGARDDRPPGPIDRRLSDAAQAERTRRVREDIARKIAERRDAANQSGASPGSPQPLVRGAPPRRPVAIPPIDPFGGPVRRMLRRIVEWIQTPPKR